MPEFCEAVRTQVRNIYGEDASPADRDGPVASSAVRCLACAEPAVKPATVLCVMAVLD